MKPRVLGTKSNVLPTGVPTSKKSVISSMAGYNNHGKILYSLSFENVQMVRFI